MCSCGGRLSRGCPNLVLVGGGPAGSPQADKAPSMVEGWQVKASSGQLLAERGGTVEPQREEQHSSFFPRRPLFHRSLLSLPLAHLRSISDLYWAFASAVPAG